MRFEIESEKEKEEVIELWLEKKGDGVINLVGRDRKGKEKYIMSFRNGGFYRQNLANLEGLDCDEDGRIKEN